MLTSVLVTYATGLGATAETALVIGEVMTHAGYIVTVAPCSDGLDADHYDAVIIGSAVDRGQWEQDAVEYLERQGPVLQERPTWLFQCEPCEEGAGRASTHVPDGVTELARRWKIDPPIALGGRFAGSEAEGLVSRWLSRGSRAGDFRNWAQIRAWAGQKADLLRDLSTAGLSPELAAAMGAE
jgi:menaquinone-dependent protoporphyrinogen oxidase